MVSLIVAVLSIIALILLDIDYPVLNGIFAGLASVLPFVGVIIATIPPLFFAYLKFQSLMAIGQVAVAFALIYFIEGYLIKPLVFKRAMEMNPLTTIIAVMACGEIMGFWGILLAIPLAASARIVIEHVRKGDFREVRP
jgi:putative permease